MFDVYGEDPQVGEVKQLNGFDQNEFTLYEVLPIGYFIFDAETFELLEGSKTVFSPYEDCDENLIYGGFEEYYRFNPENSGYLCLTTGDYLADEAVACLVEKSTELTERIANNQIEKQSRTRSVHNVVGGVTFDYVDNYDYIVNMKTKFGYAEEGDGLFECVDSKQ